MLQVTEDIRIQAIHPLISPAILQEELALDESAAQLVTRSRRVQEEILRGEDDRLIVVCGPCSIHDVDAAMEYAQKLRQAAEKWKNDLFIVMRVYFEKPRTTVGWKGLINDPHLDDSFDINTGLHRARKLLLDLTHLGLPVGTEFLDTIIPQYIADLIAWGAIGARTTESQIHRELASGLSMPVGFKNGTGGSVKIAVDAVGAARGPHHFLSVTKQGVSAIVNTKGNDTCHIILRGSSQGPNYDETSIAEAAAMLEKAGLPPYIMVDCSHGNSLKDHHNQPKVAADLAGQVSRGSKTIAGVMLESHLVEGNQSIGPVEKLTYGQSITDACINWETTEEVLENLAGAVAQRRQS